jgi:hypothetical protein
VKSRAQYGVVLTHKFATAVAADAAKIVIDADDAPLHVSSGHDRMLIQSIALVKELVVQVVNAMLERGGCFFQRHAPMLPCVAAPAQSDKADFV